MYDMIIIGGDFMSEIFKLDRFTMNIPKDNLEAIKKISQKVTAGNVSAYLNMLIFNAIQEAVEAGLIDESKDLEKTEGA